MCLSHRPCQRQMSQKYTFLGRSHNQAISKAGMRFFCHIFCQMNDFLRVKTIDVYKDLKNLKI